MSGKISRRVLDCVSGALLVALCPYAQTSPRFHEIAGVALFLALVAHVVVERKWFRTLARGIYSPVKTYRTALIAALLFVFAVQFVSGVLVSTEIFTFLPESDLSDEARQWHLALGAWAPLLVGWHLGAHWIPLAKTLAKRRKLRVVVAFAAVVLFMLGVREFYQRDVLNYMLGNVKFPSFDYEESLASALFGYFTIFCLHTIVGALLFSYFQRKSRKVREQSATSENDANQDDRSSSLDADSGEK